MSTWTVPAPEPADGPTTGDDRPMLEAYLGWQRATLLAICAGLTAEQLATRAVPPSTLSLLGLVRHLAKVERIWLRIRAAGEDIPPMYDGSDPRTADFEHDDEADAPAAVERLRAEWVAGDAAAAPLAWDHEIRDRDGDVWSLRMVYVHLCGEYARHNGHADLLRQCLDGVTGR